MNRKAKNIRAALIGGVALLSILTNLRSSPVLGFGLLFGPILTGRIADHGAIAPRAVAFFNRGKWGQHSTRNNMPESTPANSLPEIAFKRPLVNLWTAVAALDRSSYEVLALIEEGKLRFAWNIALRDVGSRDIRILTQSIVEFQNCQPAPRLSDAEDFQRAVKFIFPAVSYSCGVATVRAATIYKKFSVGHSHVLKLVDQGSLRRLEGTACRPGPNGSPQIEFSSVLDLLKRRRIA